MPWKHARRERLIHQYVKDQDAHDLSEKRLAPSLWGYAVMIPAGCSSLSAQSSGTS